jgi:hypothetical protein
MLATNDELRFEYQNALGQTIGLFSGTWNGPVTPRISPTLGLVRRWNSARGM